jgi:hypothetical protein
MSAVASETLVESIRGEESDQIIEVVVVEEEDKSRYEIRLLSFGEGIGWYVQKTLPLDFTQAKTLAKTLSKTLSSSKKKPIREDDIPKSRKVINFPVS